MTNKAPSVLFITRTYPPVRGGMEQLSYDLTTEVSKLTQTKIVANKYGKKFLPVFIPYAFLVVLFTAGNYNVIHIGDPVLSLIGWVAKKFHGKPVFSEVHGLDISYKSRIYQHYLDIFFPTVNHAICISNFVKDLLAKRFPHTNASVITPGFHDVFFQPNTRREQINFIVGKNLADKKVILTVGRLVKRKGVAWFIDNVFSKLPVNVFYIVAGSGPEKEVIKNSIYNSPAKERIILLENLSRQEIKTLYNSADLFLMPNIKINGDAEGFGLVALEAASCQLPVITADLEGIKDAVIQNENGIRYASEDELREKINALLNNDEKRKQFGIKARAFTIQNYSWNKIAERYLNIFSEATKK